MAKKNSRHRCKNFLTSLHTFQFSRIKPLYPLHDVKSSSRTKKKTEFTSVKEALKSLRANRSSYFFFTKSHISLNCHWHSYDWSTIFFYKQNSSYKGSRANRHSFRFPYSRCPFSFPSVVPRRLYILDRSRVILGAQRDRQASLS